MKIKNLILYSALSFTAMELWSCKKDSSTANSDGIQSTLELSSNDAIGENMVDDATGILLATSIDNNFSGRSSGTLTNQRMQNLNCATVTIAPLQGFPKNISIDFGPGCSNTANGIIRKGKVTVVVSDSLRKSGSVSVMNFDNYFAGGFKIDGTITWTNTSQGIAKSWQRKCENGKITASDGRYWLFSGIKNILQTEGAGTLRNLADDIYSVTGQHTITNANGISAASAIIQPLELKFSCENIDKGTVQTQGANHIAVIDFGDGTCDNLASISIDGNAPHTVLLR